MEDETGVGGHRAVGPGDHRVALEFGERAAEAVDDAAFPRDREQEVDERAPVDGRVPAQPAEDGRAEEAVEHRLGCRAVDRAQARGHGVEELGQHAAEAEDDHRPEGLAPHHPDDELDGALDLVLDEEARGLDAVVVECRHHLGPRAVDLR